MPIVGVHRVSGFSRLFSTFAALGIAHAIAPTCAPAGPVAETPLGTVRVASGLSAPVYVTHAPGDPDRLYIVEQRRQIKILKDGNVQPTAFLDVTELASCCGESGLLGLAFHPDYQGNGYFYVNYTDQSATDARVFRTVVARYTVSANPDIADPNSAQIVLMIDQPYANHNGGWMDFDADGYLYFATGDGGEQWDPEDRAQDTTDNLLGKILRLDVNRDDFPGDVERNYGIPPDNPFVGREGDDEIWVYGLRNPWRNAFDPETGELYIADVGQYAVEEINVQPANGDGGENYGWDCMEGSSCTDQTTCACNDPELTLPIHEYSHGGLPLPRCSITGGFVYRGCAIPDLNGTYFFADFCSNQIWSLRYQNGTVTDLRERTLELVPGGGLTIRAVSSFGRDAQGELYICDHVGGEIFKIVPTAPPIVEAVGTNPFDGAIDARQPFDPDGGRTASGWQSFDVLFSPASPCPNAADFAVEGWWGESDVPIISSVERVDTESLRVYLNKPLTPISQVTVRYVPAALTAVLGWLPADVNGDGTSGPADILSLIDSLNGFTRPVWSTDVDRSGKSSPPDILRVIDLLNGAGAYDAYNGVSLPP